MNDPAIMYSLSHGAFYDATAEGLTIKLWEQLRDLAEKRRAYDQAKASVENTKNAIVVLLSDTGEIVRLDGIPDLRRVPGEVRAGNPVYTVAFDRCRRCRGRYGDLNVRDGLCGTCGDDLRDDANCAVAEREHEAAR